MLFLKKLIPKDLAAKQQLHCHQPAHHEQSQHTVPKEFRVFMGVPLARISVAASVSLGPDHSGVEPNRSKEKGCHRIFQSGNHHGDKIARNGFQDVLVGSLHAVEGLGVLAGSLCKFYEIDE